MRIDAHQHVWTAPLLAALAARASPPRARREGAGWRLELPGEAPSWVEEDDPARRTALLAADGVDRAVVSLSPALGVDALPAEEAVPVLAGFAAGVDELGPGWERWGALPLTTAEPDDVDALLEAGAVGLCLPSGALAGPVALARCGPLLERLERRGAPLFVHPGPSPWAAVARPPDGAPPWWPALADYVASMHVAWHAWLAWGAPAHAGLRVAWAMLAGGAPLHLERLAARGGPADRALDPHTFYETSSYGPLALDAMVRVVGMNQLVLGSDRPVLVPPAPPGPLGPAAWEAISRVNPTRLLARDRVAA